MFKKGDKVVVQGGEFAGQRGVITGPCKISQPGEPQESGWAVKLPHGTYKLHEEKLKLTRD